MFLLMLRKVTARLENVKYEKPQSGASAPPSTSLPASLATVV
jgi:hypothetical protein